MAQDTQVVTVFRDDLDGTVLEENKVTTVNFGYENKQYTIDLSEDHALEFITFIEKYVEKATRVTTPRGARTSRGGRRGASRNSDVPKIREWARENGYEVSDRGRVNKDIQDKYYAAQKSAEKPAVEDDKNVAEKAVEKVQEVFAPADKKK